MTGKHIPGLLALGLVAATGGCLPAPGVISLAENDSGRTVDAAVGTVIRVTLSSNPTTGYEWVLAASDPGILENTRHDYVPDDASGTLVGSGGREIWEFSVRAAGTAALRLEYRRPWEPAEVEPAGVFEIVVRAAG